MEPDWVAAREVVDEMIAELGGIPQEAREWARAALGLGDDPDQAVGAA